jgi:hypothetical protein
LRRGEEAANTWRKRSGDDDDEDEALDDGMMDAT